MRGSALKGLSVGLLAMGGAAAAQAADLPSRTAPPVFAAAPVNFDDWSGVYVGTTYGYGFDHVRNHDIVLGGTRTRAIDGQIGGALVGYNAQFGHIVAGLEGSIDLNVIRGNTPTGFGFQGAHNDSLYDIRFRGILGYEFGQFMPFVAGGGVFNEGYMSGIGGVGNVPTWFGRTQQSVGWTVGAGLEYKLFPQQLFPGLPTWLLGPVTLRGEYMYQSLPDRTYAYGPVGGPAAVYKTRSDSNVVRAALIYRFGDNPPRPYADAAGDVNWAGGYGGIIGGYGTPSVRFRSLTPGPVINNRNINAEGGLGGIYAGTNFMFNRVMVGFDGTTAFTDLTGGRLVPDRGAIAFPNASDGVRYRGYVQADIRGRLGYAFGNFLPFVAAGYSFERGELTDKNTGSQRGRVPLDAFTVGGGVDYRLTQRVSLRVEDVYDFDSTRKSTPLNGCTCSVTRDGNTVRAGFAYHFE